MSTTGPEVFERSIHPANAWPKEIADETGIDRRLAWQARGVVLRGGFPAHRVPPGSKSNG